MQPSIEVCLSALSTLGLTRHQLDAGVMRTETSQQLLKPMICWTPISANLYVGFRAHGTVQQQIRAGAGLQLCRCWCALPGRHLKWNKSTASDRFRRYRTVATFVERLHLHIDQRHHGLVSPVHKIPFGTRHYHRMVPGLINEIGNFNECDRLASHEFVVNAGELLVCTCKCQSRRQCIRNLLMRVIGLHSATNFAAT